MPGRVAVCGRLSVLGVSCPAAMLCVTCGQADQVPTVLELIHPICVGSVSVCEHQCAVRMCAICGQAAQIPTVLELVQTLCTGRVGVCGHPTVLMYVASLSNGV